MKKWYVVKVYGTGYYEDVVQANSPEEAETIHQEGYTLTPTELVDVDGLDFLNQYIKAGQQVERGRMVQFPPPYVLKTLVETALAHAEQA